MKAKSALEDDTNKTHTSQALLRSVGGFVCNVTTGKPAEYDIENLETYEVNFGILASYDPSFIDTSIQILKNKL